MWKLFKQTKGKGAEMELTNEFKYVPDSIFPSKQLQDRVEEYIIKKREEELTTNKGNI